MLPTPRGIDMTQSNQLVKSKYHKKRERRKRMKKVNKSHLACVIQPPQPHIDRGIVRYACVPETTEFSLFDASMRIPYGGAISKHGRDDAFTFGAPRFHADIMQFTPAVTQ
jgi:hypothetical protein